MNLLECVIGVQAVLLVVILINQPNERERFEENIKSDNRGGISSNQRKTIERNGEEERAHVRKGSTVQLH